MIVVSIAPRAELGQNDHWEGAAHFRFQRIKLNRQFLLMVFRIALGLVVRLWFCYL